MKMRELHVVPLSIQALALLKDLHVVTGSGHLVFPSIRSRDRPISDNTLNAALRRRAADPQPALTAAGYALGNVASRHLSGMHLQRPSNRFLNRPR